MFKNVDKHLYKRKIQRQSFVNTRHLFGDSFIALNSFTKVSEFGRSPTPNVPYSSVSLHQERYYLRIIKSCLIYLCIFVIIFSSKISFGNAIEFLQSSLHPGSISFIKNTVYCLLFKYANISL